MVVYGLQVGGGWGLVERALAWVLRASVAGERYPCEVHACGCGSARSCWLDCCCMDDAGKLAWAIAEGVEPPSYVQFDDSVWIAAANRVKAGSATCGLCVGEAKLKLRRGEAAGGSAAREEAKAISLWPTVSPQSCKKIDERVSGSVVVSRVPGAVEVEVVLMGVKPVVFACAAPRAWCSVGLDVPEPPPRAGRLVA